MIRLVAVLLVLASLITGCGKASPSAPSAAVPPAPAAAKPAEPDPYVWPGPTDAIVWPPIQPLRYAGKDDAAQALRSALFDAKGPRRLELARMSCQVVPYRDFVASANSVFSGDLGKLPGPPGAGELVAWEQYAGSETAIAGPPPAKRGEPQWTWALTWAMPADVPAYLRAEIRASFRGPPPGESSGAWCLEAVYSPLLYTSERAARSAVSSLRRGYIWRFPPPE